jgi:hypothetical protein
MGPGTHVIQRVIDNVQPLSHADCLALMHDVDYLIYGGNEDDIVAADQRAIDSAQYTLEGVAMKLGLKFRSFFHLAIHETGLREVGELLKQYIKNSKDYNSSFKQFSVNISNW